MTRNPFGSIFGKVIEPKNSKGEAKKEDPAATSAYAPTEDNKKNPFSHTTSQYKATTGLQVKDPRVLLERADYAKTQKEIAYQAVNQEIDNLNKRIASSKLYLGLLSTYMTMPPKGRDEISSWVKGNSAVIKKVVDARNLKKLVNKTAQTNQDLDAEIKYLQSLVNLKRQGVDVIGEDALQYFQPTKPVVGAEPPVTGKIPVIEGKVPLKDLYTVRKLGDSDADTYFQKFKQALPSKNSYFEAHKKAYEKSHLSKDIEKSVLLERQMDWKINELAPQKEKLTIELNKLLQQISEMLEKINREIPGSEEVTTTMGVLADLKPEKFQKMDIVGGLKASSLEMSQLGDEAAIPSMTEAQDLVEITSLEAQNLMQEQKAKEAIVAKLETQITGLKPATPAAAVATATPENTTIKTITKLLPWVVGAIILYKIVE